jgi:hypothetical protein
MKLNKFLNKFLPIVVIVTALGLLLFQHNKNKRITDTAMKIAQGIPDSPSKLIGSRDKKWETEDERRELCDKLGVIYTKTLIFSDDCLHLSKIDANYLHFDVKVSRVEGKRKEYLKECVAKEYQAPIYIQWVNDAVGYGVFAKDLIHEGDYVMEYAGCVCFSVSDSTYAWAYPCVPGGFGIEKKRYMIDARLCGGEGRFVNDPMDIEQLNLSLGLVYLNGAYHNIYLAVKDIHPGEQLFVSYGDAYWSDRKGEHLSRNTQTDPR